MAGVRLVSGAPVPVDRLEGALDGLDRVGDRLREGLRGRALPVGGGRCPVGAGDDAMRRASLAASQILGLTLARYVRHIEPLATMRRHDVAAFVGPTLERYLQEPLDAATRGRAR